MKYRFYSLWLLCLCILFTTNIQAQDPLAYLREQCPQLTEMYHRELADCHAHYIFAVDVSLSMAKYEETVRPALEAFVKALPLGDKVTIIPFAHDAQANKLGFDVKIDKETRASLVQMLTTLYPQGSERRDRQYYDTDIFLAQQAVAKSIQMNSTYDVNIIVFISDLLHCPANNIDRKFSASEMSDMQTLIRAAKCEAEPMIFALELPQSGSPVGYVLPQLQEIYSEWGVKIESQKVPNNSEAMIRQWFEKQKDMIMFRKLQTIILRENRANPIVVRTETNIDGKVIAHIEWKAGKLYPRLTLDTTYLKNSCFHFQANPDFINFSEAGEINADLELGQIKHKDYGFHQLSDTLYFDVKLPVQYQGEIDKLLEGRPGALANTTEYKEGTIFTFFLPLWLTVVILVAIVLYILLFFKAIIRNAKYSFTGKMTLSDDREKLLREENLRNLSPSTTLSFGSKGTPASCAINGAEWCFVIQKKKSNPFWPFSKPKYVWKKTGGYVAKGKNQSGDVGSILKVTCGPDRDHPTHNVKVQFIDNN